MEEQLKYIKEYSRGTTEMNADFDVNGHRIRLLTKIWGVFPFIVVKTKSKPIQYELKLDRMFSYN